jgi:chemotaxis protein methyltransferase CheR
MIVKYRIDQREYRLLSKIVYEEVGINLTDAKITLVENRLTNRMMKLGLDGFSDYIRLIQVDYAEKIEMINAITTNETYFFREVEHFEFLNRYVKSNLRSFGGKKFRILSAASSIGAEAYSMAMLLYGTLQNFEIIGLDVNSDVVKKARLGLYPLSFHERIPSEYLKKFCLKGRGEYQNKFLIDKNIINNVEFFEANLIKFKNEFGIFDIVFLRNVLMYFDIETKQIVVDNMSRCLSRGGLLFLSLTENLTGLNVPYLKKVGNSVFQKC